VFVFQERALSLSLKHGQTRGENSLTPKQLPFNMKTWSQGGLPTFPIGIPAYFTRSANAASIKVAVNSADGSGR
jgi:hypothetical protein